MINLLFPSAGKNTFYPNVIFPKLLFEISGKPMIEWLIENYHSRRKVQFIFEFNESDCLEFHLDRIVSILTRGSSEIIKVKGQTEGALCTTLLAIDKIDREVPLVVANSDQIIDIDFDQVVDFFSEKKAAAGVIGFPSVHPRWSYYYVPDCGESIVEVAEKRPLSKHAIAGFYYFASGAEFVEKAMNVIRKGRVERDGYYYLSSVINEYILDNKTVVPYEIKAAQYHSFYESEKARMFSQMCSELI